MRRHRNKHWFFTLGLGALMLVPALASAHAVLLDPTPRNPNDFNKDETMPCGAATPRGTPTVFAPGQTITVQWKETVEHPGHYELAFSMADDQSFQNMGGDIADDTDGTTLPHLYQQTITLPDQTCETCTLRMVQVMGDDANTEYRSCADIAIRAGTAEDADGGPDVDAGPTPDAGPAGPVGIGDPPGLCSVAPGRHSSPWSAVWLGAAITLMGAGLERRRRK
jgi:hypothetical protein